MNSENAEIITLLPTQWEDYKNLRLRALKDAPDAFGTNYNETLKRSDQEWREMIQEAVEGKRRWMFFARLNDKLVGMLQGTTEDKDDTVKIKAVFVGEEARGQGVGKKLMLRLLEELYKHPQLKKVELGVYTPNEAAINLYKSVGFKVVGIGKDTSLDGKVHERTAMEFNLS